MEMHHISQSSLKCQEIWDTLLQKDFQYSSWGISYTVNAPACYHFKVQKEEKGCGGKSSLSVGLL